MNVHIENNRIIISDAEFFQPKATIESGQIFRFEKLGENDYNVFSKCYGCRVLQSGSTVTVLTDTPEYFYRYFDLDTDYENIIKELAVFDEIKNAIAYGKGIRIVKQDLAECIISFIISANNNIPRIKGIISRLCATYGEDMGSYYSFPSLEKLKTITKDEFRAIGAGFRDRYLYESIMAIDESFLRQLQAADTCDARKILMTLTGVGDKVADCIALFGLSRFDCCPVDTWMLKAAEYTGLSKVKEVREYYNKRYGKYSGLVQQYIFYHKRETSGVSLK